MEKTNVSMNIQDNPYVSFPSRILEVIRHTQKEYTFRMEYSGEVRPGQFFEVSIPKYGEAPISVSGIGDHFVDLTIRRVGRVTNEVFEYYTGQSLLMRGPYGNGFDTSLYEEGEVLVIAGGTGVSPVRGVIDALAGTELSSNDPSLPVEGQIGHRAIISSRRGPLLRYLKGTCASFSRRST